MVGCQGLHAQEFGEISPFLWADVVVTPNQEEKKGKEQEVDVDEGYESTEKKFDFKAMHKSKK